MGSSSGFLLSLLLCMVTLLCVTRHVVGGVAVTNYTVQVRLFVDSEAVRKWKANTGMTNMDDLELEITSIFLDIDDLYSSLIKHIDIDFNFEILNITFLNKTFFDPGTHGNDAIKTFSEWTEPTYDTSPYDLALLLTGVRMTGGIGFGYTGRICTKKAVGLVPMTTTFRDAIIWAHEMGHILGSEHDPDHKRADLCYYDAGYVMSATIHNQPKDENFLFSECTGSYLRYKMETLTKEGKNCLTDGGETVSGKRLGKIVTPDGICQRMFGVKAFADAKPYKRYPHEICLKLYCQKKPYWQNLYSRDFTWSPQGMKCGKNKACVMGRCVEDPDGNPFVSDECPFGDQLKTGYESYWDEVCGDIDVRSCHYYKQDCCHTCNTTASIYQMTADEVCQTFDGNGSALQRGHYSAYGDELCSDLKCIKGHVGAFKITGYEAPDGMACGKNKRCYKSKCVKSRHGDTTIEDSSCPFGDQDLKALGYRGTCPQQNCLAWKSYCCHSCKGDI